MPHLLGDRLEEYAHGIRTRTLVLVGDRDPIVPPEWAGAVAGLVPGARLEIVTGAHVIMHTDPEGVARAIAEHAR
jgi:pimeloyl-ACP methyl ester carboxylesterase